MYFDWVKIILTTIYVITLFYTVFLLLLILEPMPKLRKKIKEWPMVTVAIPAYNEEESLSRSVESVLNLDYPRDKLEVIIINDGSKDKTLQVAKRLAKDNKNRIIKIINQPNQGKYVAMNNALAKAKGEYFVCLDADSMISTNALKNMLPAFVSDEIAVVIPLMKVRNPKSLLEKMQWYEYILNKFYNLLLSQLNCLHVAPGPFSVYRKDVVIKIGGFKKAHNTEDLEIALRLQKNHYKLVQVTNAQVTTISPNTLRDLYYQRNRWNKGSFLNVMDYRKMMFKRSYGDFGIFNLPMVLASGFFAVILFFMTVYFSFIKPTYKTIYHLSLVNYDIVTYLHNLTWDITWLDLDYYSLVISIFVIVIATLTIILSHKVSKERVGSKGIFPLLMVLLFYYIILGLFWIGVFKDLMTKKFASKW